MADLIDRQAIFPNGVFFVNAEKPIASLGELFNRIWSLPAVDAVEVVRCKDCVYYYTDNCSPGCGWCEHFERGEFDNHYCYGGDRREENAAD